MYLLVLLSLMRRLPRDKTWAQQRIFMTYLGEYLGLVGEYLGRRIALLCRTGWAVHWRRRAVAGRRDVGDPYHSQDCQELHQVIWGSDRHCSFEQNLNRLFEGTTHQCTSVSTVDTVTGNSHEVTAGSHNVDQEGKMAMVNIRTVERKHLLEFSHQCGSSSLDTEHAEDIDKVVGVSARRVSALNCKNFLESSSTGIQEPFLTKGIALGHGERTIFLDAQTFLEVDKSTIDAQNTTKSGFVQQISFESPDDEIGLESGIIIFLGLHKHVRRSDTDNKLIGVVITEDNRHLLVVNILDSSGNISDRKTLVQKLSTAKNDTQIEPNFGLLSNGAQTGVLNQTTKSLASFLIKAVFSRLVDSHGRCLDVGSNVQNFLQTGHTKRDVLGRDTSEMESVERHLCCGFSNRLCGQDANHFTGTDKRSRESVQDITKNVVKSELVQGGLEENSGVVLCFLGKRVVTTDNNNLVKQVLNLGNNIGRVKITTSAILDAESGLSTLDNTGDVKRKLVSFFVIGTALSEQSSVSQQCFILSIERHLGIHDVNTELLLELTVGAVDDIQLLAFDMHSIQAIFTVDELYNIA
ncbi:RNA polymerase II largest subunit, partial [Aureobasidium melanogenum]